MSNPTKIKLLRYFFRKFPRAIEAIAEVARAGDAKHNGTVRSYTSVENGHQEYSEAMVRHIFDEIIEGPIDPEDKGLHAAKIAWGALARLEIQLERIHGAPADYQYSGGSIGKVQKSMYASDEKTPYDRTKKIEDAFLPPKSEGKSGVIHPTYRKSEYRSPAPIPTKKDKTPYDRTQNRVMSEDLINESEDGGI